MASNMFSLGSAFSDVRAEPVNYWGGFRKTFNPVRMGWKGANDNQDALFKQYQTGIEGNLGAAKANAQTYADYTKNLFTNPQDSFGDYSKMGDYLYGKLNDYTDILKDSGLRDMNLRLAGQGIRPGSTGYDRLLNATRITSNMVPAFNNTTNALNTGYNTVSNDTYRNMLTRLGLANQDALTQYADQPYQRYLDIGNNQQAMYDDRLDWLNKAVNAHKANTAGFQLKENSDVAKGIGVVDNLLNGVVDLYSSYMGGGMGGGVGGNNSSALQNNGSNFLQQMGGSMGNASGGQGGGQSSQQNQQILQMLLQMIGNRGGQSSASGSIPQYSGADFSEAAG